MASGVSQGTTRAPGARSSPERFGEPSPERPPGSAFGAGAAQDLAEISITFTAGRKESGISAAMDIEDTDLPQFGEAEPATLELVRSIPAELLAVQDNMVALANDLTGIKEEPEPAEEVTTKTTSLFG